MKNLFSFVAIAAVFGVVVVAMGTIIGAMTTLLIGGDFFVSSVVGTLAVVVGGALTRSLKR